MLGSFSKFYKEVSLYKREGLISRFISNNIKGSNSYKVYYINTKIKLNKILAFNFKVCYNKHVIYKGKRS